MRRSAFLFSLLLVGAWAAAARYPSPLGYVTDEAGLLDARSAAAVSALLSDLDQKAQAQMAVVTVKDMGGEDVEGYANGLFEAWGIGDKKTNRGVLLLVSAGDRKARIETGYGLEGILPDGLCGRILDQHLIPAFKRGDFTAGLLDTTAAVAQIIAKDKAVQLTGLPRSAPRRDPATQSPLARLLLLICFLLLIPVFIRHPILLFLLMSGGRGGSRGGGGFGGGGFGGFGGGMSGGGGASRGW